MVESMEMISVSFQQKIEQTIRHARDWHQLMCHVLDAILMYT